MTKLKHPSTRAERLLVKRKHEEKRKDNSGSVRKLKREAVKEEETINELREYASH